jgi:hypothetical protein
MSSIKSEDSPLTEELLIMNAVCAEGMDEYEIKKLLPE